MKWMRGGGGGETTSNLLCYYLLKRNRTRVGVKDERGFLEVGVVI